jgi:hypothetical protein
VPVWRAALTVADAIPLRLPGSPASPTMFDGVTDSPTPAPASAKAIATSQYGLAAARAARPR